MPSALREHTSPSGSAPEGSGLSRTGHPGRGLHLGWIPNDPGRRPRDFAEAAPADPSPDPARVRAAKDATDRALYFARLLIGLGVIVALVFGGLGFIHRLSLLWGVAVVLALACWIPASVMMWSRRRAVAALERDTADKRRLHAAELVKYNERKNAWNQSEAERAAKAPKWLRVRSHEDISRLDVFGGTVAGRENMLTGLGLGLLEEHAVLVLDLSRERVCDGLLAAAGQSGHACQDYRLPRDLHATPLLSGLTGDEIASQIVEVLHADDPRATAAGRATDLLILNKIHRALGPASGGTSGGGTGLGGTGLSMARLHAALGYLLGDTAPDEGPISEAERTALDGAFGETFRREAASGLIRLAAVTEPLRDLGRDGAARTPARLTCLSLADGPRGVTADLIAALIVQWATHSIVADLSASGAPGTGGPGADPKPKPAVILAGGDEQDQRHLARLTGVCERYGVPLVRTFSRLTEESARHLDSRNTAFMRLPTRPEALRAAEHIGLERRFVAGSLSLSQRVSKSRTRTVGESVSHSTGHSEGGAITRTKGTTVGESSTETEQPYRNPNVTVNVSNNVQNNLQNNLQNNNHIRNVDAGGRESRAGGDGKGSGKNGNAGAKKGSAAANGSAAEKRGSGGGSGSGAGRQGSAGSKAPDGGFGGKPGWVAGGGSKGSYTLGGARKGSTKPDGIDIVRSKTKFAMRHQSESKTQSWEDTEETSHTTSSSTSKTEGTSTGDEITYELSYEHKVAPETLMDLPDDQMLAPHVTESAALAHDALGPGRGANRIVALVINPAIVGESVAPAVTPDEIPAYQAPPAALPEGVRDRLTLPDRSQQDRR